MRKLFKIFALVLFAILVVYGAFYTRRLVEMRKARASQKKEASPPPKVYVHRIQKKTLERIEEITGNVKAFAEVNVVPKVTGRLERLRLPNGKLLEEGDEVKKGDVIAIIEHSALEAAVQQSRAAIEVAKASYERAKVNLEDSEREKKRWESVYERGATSEQQRDQAVMAYKRSLADLSLCKSQIEQTQAALFQADVNLKEATIATPTSGTISQKFVDEGNMVGLGTPLVKISQIDTVKVVADVSERHLPFIVQGKTPVRIVSDSLPDREFTGTVFMVGVGLDAHTRTGQIEIRVPNPERRLRPGMFTRMNIVLERHKDVPVVPDAALIRRGEDIFTYVVNNSRIHSSRLVLGISEGDYHEVLEGLQPGDMVIVSGQRLLKENDMVETAEEERQ
ncbi:MAG: efflux RND transporter periplasmic adaptor subunit [Candidatus Sumerlaeota bacterium]|nr:efflux RND transporter periplasmic adaptor subunit [Candidatus Sumerlaeota bacterium]